MSEKIFVKTFYVNANYNDWQDEFFSEYEWQEDWYYKVLDTSFYEEYMSNWIVEDIYIADENLLKNKSFLKQKIHLPFEGVDLVNIEECKPNSLS